MNLEGRKAGKHLTHSVLTQRVIGAAIEVHRALGPGFIESIYEAALSLELDAQGLQFERQKTVPVIYRSHVVGEHRLDFFVEQQLVVELKATKALEDVHFAIVRSYMKACGVEAGLLLNFATMPLTIRRVGRETSHQEESASL